MCVEFGSPLMIHTGNTLSETAKLRFSHPLNIDDVAVENPELKIIMCHLGNPWILDCQEVMYKNKNVYADISGLVSGGFTQLSQEHYTTKLRDLLCYIGEEHHLLYGSDWPICDMGSYLRFVQKLELGQDPFNLLMSRNAKCVYGL